MLVHQALTANIDVPFLALVLAAAAMEARRPRRGWPVLAALAVAGLLRPEAWLLGLAYGGVAVAGGDAGAAGARAGHGAGRPCRLAAVRPLAGRGRAALAARDQQRRHPDRPASGFGRAVRLTPSYLVNLLQVTIAVGGAAAAVLALWKRRRQALPR